MCHLLRWGGFERKKTAMKNSFYFGHIKFKMQERKDINANLLTRRDGKENIRDNVTEHEDVSYTVPGEQTAHMRRDVS